MSNHSPTPWSASAEDLRGGRYFTITIPGTSETIDLHEDDNGEANAAFIVRAVNAHDALVKASRLALETLGNSSPKRIHPALVQRQKMAEDDLRAALKLAGEA